MYDEIIKKLKAKDKLTEKEICCMLCESPTLDESYGDNRRWSRSVMTVIDVEGDAYAVYWEEGLTECQENEYYNQPIKVVKKEYEKVIKVVEWVEVDDAEKC